MSPDPAFGQDSGEITGAPPGGSRTGLCTFSCHLHWAAAQAGEEGVRFRDTPGFVDYARELGADGVQAPLRAGEDEKARAVRLRLERTGGYYEGDVRFPQSEADVGRFAEEVRLAREAGAAVIRTYFTAARRYEAFASEEAFLAFRRRSEEMLQRVEPVLRKERMRLALENHKDFTVPELVELLDRLDSEWIGVQLDTGNNIALLEDPHAVVEALAPFAFSVHLKDMSVQEAPDGFLLSEVPFGEGFLDLFRIVTALRAANPGIVFNVEMATRDPLRVPCKTAAYWATFPLRRAEELAAALARVAAHPARHPLPTLAGMDAPGRLAAEELHNRRCLAYARAHLAAG